MNFTVVVEQVLILLIILVVGIVSGKVGFIADGASKNSRSSYYMLQVQ